MNPATYGSNGRFRRRKCQKIAKRVTGLLAASCAVAQIGKLSVEKRANIENTISRFMAASRAPGISVAVVQDGEFVWSAGFGMADLENSVPATSQTFYGGTHHFVDLSKSAPTRPARPEFFVTEWPLSSWDS